MGQHGTLFLVRCMKHCRTLAIRQVEIRLDFFNDLERFFIEQI